MFLKYLEPLFKPWREARSKVVQVKTTKGNFKAETARVKRFGAVAKKQAGMVDGAKQAQAGVAKGPAPKMPGMAAPKMPGMRPPPGGDGKNMPQQDPPANFVPNPPLRAKGLFVKTLWCTQCGQQMDKSWTGCPYCAQAYQPQSQAPKNKTQAFILPQAGGNSRPMLAWLVGIKGPQRGEVFTLSGPAPNIIGTAPTCTVMLEGNYISGQHMEIVYKGDLWMLRDLGSSNGTMANSKRVTEHELLENDIIDLGDCSYKFKEL